MVEPGSDPDLFAATAELGAALRDALAAAVCTSASPAVLQEAAARIRQATTPLSAHQRHGSVLSPLDDMERGVRVFGPVVGEGHGFAVPLVFEPHGSGVLARATLGRVYEGPPTFLHGGIAAMLMDQVLGQAAIVAGRWGMTVELSMRYRRPVPLDTPLRLTGRMTEAVGRRTTVVGTIATEDHPDTPLVEATGVFVTPSAETSGTYFSAVRTASGRPADGRLGPDGVGSRRIPDIHRN